MDYRMRYKHGEHHMETGFFDSDAEAMRWWELMTKSDYPDALGKPRDWILERREGPTWVQVAAHDAGKVDE